MTAQQDFWKPKPYDFKEIIAGVDLNKLSTAYVNRSKAHAKTYIRYPETWGTLERFYDMYDKSHFENTSISPEKDVWDNRRKVAAK
jgi:hypothetical protein